MSRIGESASPSAPDGFIATAKARVWLNSGCRAFARKRHNADLQAIEKRLQCINRGDYLCLGKDNRFKIQKPTKRARYRRETGMTACDPSETSKASSALIARFVRFQIWFPSISKSPANK
jgi:hypothetical protein